MGKNAKRRQERKTKHIRLAGEQAEVFDNQMDVDSEWFQNSDEPVFFRPQIEGEWNQHTATGKSPPTIDFFDEDGQVIEAKKDWTCVVDVGRVLKGGGPASGFRTRLAVAAPITPPIRQAMKEQAIAWAQVTVEALRQQASQQ